MYIVEGLALGQITVVIPDELDNKLRTECRFKGDMSRIVTKALHEYYKNKEVTI